MSRDDPGPTSGQDDHSSANGDDVRVKEKTLIQAKDDSCQMRTGKQGDAGELRKEEADHMDKYPTGIPHT